MGRKVLHVRTAEMTGVVRFVPCHELVIEFVGGCGDKMQFAAEVDVADPAKLLPGGDRSRQKSPENVRHHRLGRAYRLEFPGVDDERMDGSAARTLAVDAQLDFLADELGRRRLRGKHSVGFRHAVTLPGDRVGLDGEFDRCGGRDRRLLGVNGQR